MDELPDKIYYAWRDIGYYCAAEVFEHVLNFTVYEMYLCQSLGEEEWDGTTLVPEGNAPSGYAFDRLKSCATPKPVKKTEEAQIFMHGSIKWDGCSDIYFDHQDWVMLHFCGRKAATNLGVLLDRLYDMAERHVPDFGLAD